MGVRQVTAILISGCFRRTCVCIPTFPGRTTGHHTEIDITRFQVATRFEVIQQQTAQRRPLVVQRLDLPPITAAVRVQLPLPRQRPRPQRRQARHRLLRFILIPRIHLWVQPPVESITTHEKPGGMSAGLFCFSITENLIHPIIGPVEASRCNA